MAAWPRYELARLGWINAKLKQGLVRFPIRAHVLSGGCVAVDEAAKIELVDEVSQRGHISGVTFKLRNKVSHSRTQGGELTAVTGF